MFRRKSESVADDSTVEHLPTAGEMLWDTLPGETEPSMVIGGFDGVTVPYDRSDIGRRIIGLMDREAHDSAKTPDQPET